MTHMDCKMLSGNALRGQYKTKEEQMDKVQSIPRSEASEVKGLNRFLYKAMDWLGLHQG